MKRQRSRFNFSAISYLLLVISLFSGCAKVDTTRVNITSNLTTQSTIATDEVTVNSEFDNAIDDAIKVLCNPSTSFTHALAYSVTSNVYEISYYGNETNGTKSRAGNDSIHLGSLPWSTPQAAATVTFGDVNYNEYEVSFLTNNGSLRFTGNASITNVSGGLLQNLSAGDSMVVHIRATIAFTYNDQNTGAQTYTWYLNQLRTFTLSDTNTFATTRGDTTINGSANVSTWGAARTGNNFYNIVTSAVVQNISDPYLSYNPVKGSTNIEGIPESILSTYGVNSQGSVITSGTPYGFLITWYNEGHASDVIPYYY